MIATLASLVFALATPLAAGHGILRLIARGDAVGPAPERLALAWLLGAGYISLALFFCGLVTGGVALPVLVAAGAVLLFIAGNRRPLARFESPPLTRVEWLLAALLVAQLAFVAWCARSFMLGWDGIAVWEVKMQVAFKNGGALPAAYFSDLTRADSHPRYPLYWPGTGTWLYLCLGRVDQSWLRLLGVVFYAAAAGLLTGAVQRLGQSRTAGLVAAAGLFFVPLLVSSPNGVCAGYADFPLAALCLAAVARMPGWRTNTAASDRRLFAVLAMLMVWTKADGVVLLAALLAAAWLAQGWRRLPRVLLMALPAVALLAVFNIYLRSVNAPADHYAAPTPGNIVSHIGRALPSCAAMLSQTLDWSQWSLLWPGAVLALATLAVRGRCRCALLLLVVMGLPVIGYTFVYVLSTWGGPSYLVHIQLSASRLFIGFCPVALLAIGLALPCGVKN
jgi:hypothetical protein